MFGPGLRLADGGLDLFEFFGLFVGGFFGLVVGEGIVGELVVGEFVGLIFGFFCLASAGSSGSSSVTDASVALSTGWGLAPGLRTSDLVSFSADAVDCDDVVAFAPASSSAAATAAPAMVAADTPAASMPALNHAKIRSVMPSPSPTAQTVTAIPADYGGLHEVLSVQADVLGAGQDVAEARWDTAIRHAFFAACARGETLWS